MNHNQHFSTNERLGQLERMVWSVHRKLDSLLRAANLEINLELENMSALSDLQAAVARNGEVEASAVTLIQGIAQQLKDALANNDTAALAELSTNLSSQADSLAAAVTANTQQPAPSLGGT